MLRLLVLPAGSPPVARACKSRASRPLRSTPITGASPLLRAGPPACAASVLDASQFLLLGVLPPGAATPTRPAVPVSTPRLPTFRTGAADQTHSACMPGTTWPIGGHPPGSSRSRQVHPGFDAVFDCFDTSSAVHSRSSFWSPSDGSYTAFSSTAHHDSRQLTQREVIWCLPPQGGTGGPQILHLLYSTASSESFPTYRLLSAFVAQLGLRSLAVASV